jgi:membrane fusion protein, multidrug efflux system
VSSVKQILIAGVILLVIGGGAFWYHRDDGEGASAAIREEPPPVPVTVARASLDTISERIEAVGSTLARQAVDIVSLDSGRVVEIGFAPGDQVEAGTLLVRLDDATEQAAVAEAEAELREAELALERARQLRANNTIAQATVDEREAEYRSARARLDRAEKQLAERSVRAPFAGVVGMKRIDVGARVDDSTILTTLDDLAEVEVDFSVPEVFFGRVRPGQEVSARSSAFAGETFIGRIATIDTRIGEVSRAFRVRAVLPNPDLVLPAGMFMHVEVVLSERETVLIPEETVLAEGNQTFVFVIEGEQAVRRPVRLGQREAGRVEVIDGLGGGERVARGGLQRLRDGAVVEIRGGEEDAPAAAPAVAEGEA